MKAKIFGVFLLFEAFFQLLASAVAFYYYYYHQEKDVVALLASTMITGIAGFILLSAGREIHKNKRGKQDISNLDMKDSFVIVTLTWILFTVFGMLPFIFYGTFTNVTDAFFETMSGLTTTGSTLLNNIDIQPHGILFWRSILQWLGGLGIIVLFLAILPAINRNSNKTMLFSAEVSGLGVQKLHPKMGMTARKLWMIYIILTAVCAFLYWLGPMNLYDAVCHSFTTVASGGFSTHQLSIGFYHSSYLEYVCSIFMIASGINFSLFYFLFTGRLSLFRKNEELRWYLGIIVFTVALFTTLFYIAPDVKTVATDIGAYPPDNLESKFRTSLFHVTSILTSTGYQGEYFNYTLWGGLFIIPTLLIMASGACAGSTSGGIKIIREVICLKSLNNVVKQMLHPNAVFSVRISKEIVVNDKLLRVLNFLFFYILLFIFGVILMVISGCPFNESIFNVVTSISNCGPGLGSTGPDASFAGLSDFAKWIMSFYMLVGRLEIFTVIVLFTHSFWSKK